MAAAPGLRVPYPTIVGLEQALTLLASLKPRTRVDRAFLLGQGFAPNAAGPILDALVWLGVLDPGADSGVAARGFLADPRRHAVAALAPVLAGLPAAGALSPPYPDRKTLIGALRPRFAHDDTTLPLVATFLDWVARKAGIDLIVRGRAKPGARPGVPRPPRPASLLRARVKAAEAAARSSQRTQAAARMGSTYPYPEPAPAPTPTPTPTLASVPTLAAVPTSGGPALSFQLVIDRNTTADDLDRMVREVKDAMQRLRREDVP